MILDEWTTPYYICYAPKELEAICEVAKMILDECKSVEKLRDYNMNLFKERLHDIARKIRPTIDIALFGRKLHDSGLKEYEPALELSYPIKIG